ncbi:hypothetical protein V8C42DRAFT_99191 [Trichoderma barbatum]
MARTKRTNAQIKQEKRRSTWTRFHLPRGQDWPTWPSGTTDLGPLAGVTGYEKTVWDSADALKNFQDSPACVEFLQGLPQNDVVPGALLQRLSLSEAGATTSSAPPPSRFPSLHWNHTDKFEEKLEGRVTFTALLVPYTGAPDRQKLRSSVIKAFDGFMPADCDDLRPPPPPDRNSFPVGFWPGLVAFLPKWSGWVWTWTDTGDSEWWHPGQQTTAEESGNGQMVLCLLRQWDGYYGATPEREEASANHPLAKESWAQAVAKVMPPVTAWVYERLDIQLAPSYIVVMTQEDADRDAVLNEELGREVDE